SPARFRSSLAVRRRMTLGRSLVSVVCSIAVTSWSALESRCVTTRSDTTRSEPSVTAGRGDRPMPSRRRVTSSSVTELCERLPRMPKRSALAIRSLGLLPHSLASSWIRFDMTDVLSAPRRSPRACREGPHALRDSASRATNARRHDGSRTRPSRRAPGADKHHARAGAGGRRAPARSRARRNAPARSEAPARHIRRRYGWASSPGLLLLRLGTGGRPCRRYWRRRRRNRGRWLGSRRGLCLRRRLGLSLQASDVITGRGEDAGSALGADAIDLGDRVL